MLGGKIFSGAVCFCLQPKADRINRFSIFMFVFCVLMDFVLLRYFVLLCYFSYFTSWHFAICRVFSLKSVFVSANRVTKLTDGFSSLLFDC